MFTWNNSTVGKTFLMKEFGKVYDFLSGARLSRKQLEGFLKRAENFKFPTVTK